MIDNQDASRIAAVFPTNFWTDQEQVSGTGEFVNVDHVEWQKKGNPGQGGGGKVKTIMRHEPAVWEALKPFYEAWKKGEDAPLNGTALTEWPPITKRMSEHLKMQGLRTVEDLAGTTDADLERVGMGGRDLRNKAQAYIALKNGDAKSSAVIADKDRQIQVLTERLEEALAAIKSLPVVEAPKRGRPKKEE